MRYAGHIQPIIVRRSGTHEQTVEAVARASVAAWLSTPDHPAWEPWLAASFGKTVRRARPAEVEKCREFFVASAAVGEAEAFACLPVPTDQLPAPIRKLQVSGTDAERNGWPRSNSADALPPGPIVIINFGANMTTGKTAAQVAHGVFAWALKQAPRSLADWQETGMPFSVCEVPPATFEGFRRDAKDAIVIEDAGHTEVEPGTATVLVRL